MYICGITPYDNAHVGHGRCYVTFDMLYRLLKTLGYQVTYARNFTDIDDKLLNRAREEFGDQMRYLEIAERYMKSFTNDMRILNCLVPDVEPRATKTITQILDLIQKLIEKGHAYVVDGDVYFAVRSMPDYGKLSGRNLDDLRAGARVEISDLKRDPLDFALWKGELEGTFWKSPWGYGRPGWHIECSAMACSLLAPHIDIHGGGMDLIFPHHENEVAQSEGVYGPNFANYWLHIAFVRINQEKMSKSLGNFFTLKDIMTQFDSMVLRFYYLNHNYMIPLDFSFEGLTVAQKTYAKLCRLFQDTKEKIFKLEEFIETRVANAMLNALCDDLNTAGALGILFEHVELLKTDEHERSAVKYFLRNIFGLTLEVVPEKEVSITPEIQQLIDEREAARKAKDWKTADKLRDRLRELGYDIQDKKL
jgi:cysteinyl-tRNA synthetase